MKILDGRKIPYEVHRYSETERDSSRVAQDLGAPSGQVCKTLVAVRSKGKPLLVMIPGNRKLDLKKLARAVGDKKIKLAGHHQAEALTGLKVGGISALALLNRGFEIYLDRSTMQYQQVYVSAGRRGLNIKLPVAELARIVKARLVDATVDS